MFSIYMDHMTVWSWSVCFQTGLRYSLVIHSKKEKKKIPTWESPLYFIVMERPILLIGYNFSIDYLTSSSLATLLLCFLCSILQFSQMH